MLERVSIRRPQHNLRRLKRCEASSQLTLEESWWMNTPERYQLPRRIDTMCRIKRTQCKSLRLSVSVGLRGGVTGLNLQAALNRVEATGAEGKDADPRSGHD